MVVNQTLIDLHRPHVGAQIRDAGREVAIQGCTYSQATSVSEHAGKHPDLADEIRELFPTIAATERLKARRGHSSDGRASLRAVKLERLGDIRLLPGQHAEASEAYHRAISAFTEMSRRAPGRADLRAELAKMVTTANDPRYGGEERVRQRQSEVLLAAAELEAGR